MLSGAHPEEVNHGLTDTAHDWLDVCSVLADMFGMRTTSTSKNPRREPSTAGNITFIFRGGEPDTRAESLSDSDAGLAEATVPSAVGTKFGFVTVLNARR